MKKRETIYTKLILAYIIFAFLAFVLVSTVTMSFLRGHVVSEHVFALNRQLSSLAEFYTDEYHRQHFDRELVFRYLKSVADYTESEIWVMDETGRVVLSSEAETADEPVDIFVDAFDPTHIRGYVIGNMSGHFDRDMLSVYTVVAADFQIQGYIIMHMPLSYIMRDMNDLLNIYYISAALIFLISLIILLVFTIFVYRPLRKIIRATEEYAKGNYEYELKSTGNDEMGYLSATLGYMAEEIARSEENEKKFIANVSHDFRSPLTSIRGYLEAIMDGTIPPELTKKYLGIVLNETERLTGLTNSLLQLNSLNVRGLSLDRKDFDINFTIKRTCETFEGRCRDRDITIDLVLTGESMMVEADESRIKQVLYNLLDNAIKFSRDHSTIKIETTEKAGKLFISVRDEGEGIPKESLGHIFDRFYKTDPSRGRDKKGTGLGLAIVKEIIKAHDENINVISTVGVGTEFIFTLPVCA